MALLQTPNFSPTQYHNLEIDKPCYGGINLNNIEYEQELNQSPDVLNMMYRNGGFGKRYGQENVTTYEDPIYAMAEYRGQMIIHTGTNLYVDDTLLENDLPESKGHFFSFNRFLYYICDGHYYQYGDMGNGLEWEEVEPYIPDIIINRSPDGESPGDKVDDLNRLGTAFKVTFHSDGTSTVFKLPDELKPYDNVAPKVFIRDVETTDFTYDMSAATVTLNTAPEELENSVVVQAHKTDQSYIDTLMECTQTIAYGGTNNSRIFFGGNGTPAIYWSDVADATYFPETNYAIIGNTNDGVSCFGEQYDTLMVFKPREIYSIKYYQDDEGIGRFQSALVNADMGCDCPNSIKLINNLLVWCSTVRGVCTLVSTNIEDERNVRVISKNIDGGHRVNGLLEEDGLKDCLSIDYESKYMLYVNGRIYCWDYYIAPYYNSGRLETDASRLSWFIFDNFLIESYLNFGNDLYYSSDGDLNRLTNTFYDFDEEIKAHYQTPLLQFGQVEYLKTVKNVYVQTRGDTASIINMKYITEEAPKGEEEPEPIIVAGRIWKDFSWDKFGWARTNYGATFRRKCNLKKIQMCAIMFENSDKGRDLSLSHLSFQYTVLKYIK